MNAQTTLATGVLAALSISPLLAQQQSPGAGPKPYYQYRDTPPACSPQLTQAPVEQAIRNGLAALKSQKGEQSVCWLRVAAAQGSAFAQGGASLLIVLGTDGAPVDAVEARTLAIKAVRAHNFLADLAMYYLELGPRGEETESARKWWKAFNDDSAKATPEELAAGNIVTDELNAEAARIKASEGKSPISRNGAGISQYAELPQLVHICASGCSAGRGAILTLENGDYVLRDAQGIANRYHVVKFTAESVILQRTDYRPRPTTATVTGRISADGNALIDGKILFPGASSPNPFQMAWGAAIDSVPGTSPQPTQQAAQQPGMQQAQQALQMAMQELNPNGAPVNTNPAALWGALLGSLAEDAANGDLTDRITSLQRAESDARESCNRARPIEGACSKLASVKDQLRDANGQLAVEIQHLQEAHKTLDANCKGGNADACKKLDQVDARLKKDQAFRFQQIF